MSTQFMEDNNSSSADATFSCQHQYQFVSQSIEVLKRYWKEQIEIEKGVLPAMDERGNTLLHLLAADGKAKEISGLAEEGLLKAEHLRVGNNAGDTPLHQAARFGQKNVAEVLVKVVLDHDHVREQELCSAPNSWDETPTYLAAAYGWKELFYFLKANSYDGVVLRARKDGWTILHALVMAERYDFALEIVKEYPDLADRPDKEGMTALHIMASKPQTFRSGSRYAIINLGFGTFIPIQLIEILLYYCSPSGDVANPNPSSSFFSTFLSTLSSGYAQIFTPLFTACPAIKTIYETKTKHGYAEQLAEKLIKETEQWRHLPNLEDKNNLLEASPSRKRNTVRNEMFVQVEEIAPLEAYENGKKKRVVEMGSEDRESIEVYDYMEKDNSSKKKRAPSNPLLEAARNRIIELVRMIVEYTPDVANGMVDEDGKNVLHVVAESKSVYMYEYLMKSKLVKWDMLRLAVDRFGNTIWHHAANCANHPNVLFGPGNFMTWDTFWFKFVGRDCDPYLQEHRNSDGFTATELYIKNHKSLREDATKEAKDMNQGLMLVSALIGTVNYSALITLPGGYNQDNGEPIFGQSGHSAGRNLLIFMINVAVALLASMFALGSQLAIQLSRFLYEDYLFSLSFKYLLATTSLFYATNYSVLVCVQVFILQGILDPIWYKLLWLPCLCSFLVYLDAMYLTYNHMYFLYLYFWTNKHARQRTNRGISKYLY